jgi:DNA-binding protein Fis
MATTGNVEKFKTGKKISTSPLRDHILTALKSYFSYLNGNDPGCVHRLVFEEVESAMYEAIMKFTKGNQSRAATLLGVSRGTLRTKLKRYFSTTHIGLEEW